MVWTSGSGRKIVAIEDDITRVGVDAIVNAANAELAGGGGVDGAIHRAGGPQIMRELDTIRRTSGGCPTGNAVVTSAGLLPAKYVFHAVGPIYRGGQHGESALLASCYQTCLRLAEEHEVATISFPAISTGVYGYPLEKAAQIAVHHVKSHLESPDVKLKQAIFVLYGKHAYEVYAKLLAA